MKQDRKEKIDSFWDISRLVPPEKESRKYSPFKTEAELFEIHLESSAEQKTEENQILHFTSVKRDSEKNSDPSEVYENLSFLIRRVEIVPWKNSYNYYEFFCRNAIAYQEIHGKECPRVSFFSYVPQYSQMNPQQLNFYFWWRENIRKHVYIETEIGYIYLYLYEVINLGELLDAQEALETLIGIWSHYRNTYPQLDKSLSEWICDYSLLHRIPLSFPDERINRDMISHCSLREIYYHFDETDAPKLASFLLNDCNKYDYRKSKYYDDKTQKLYDTYIPTCFEKILPFLRMFGTDKMQLRHISRVAFMGALCSYRVRKHIEVDFVPLVGAGDLKYQIADLIKYMENKLRSYLGIRSRLGVREIPDEIKNEIDKYFLTQFTGEIPDTKPEYEKLYEPNKEVFSLEKALNIERNSWNVTEKLIEAFDEDVPHETPRGGFVESVLEKAQESSESTPSITDDPVSAFLNEIFSYRSFFYAVLLGDDKAQREFCKENRLFEENVVDSINEKAADTFGDIVIEESTDGGYRLIEDYREMFHIGG